MPLLRCVQEPGVTRPARETPEEGLHRSGVRLVAASRTDQGLDTLGVHLGNEYYLLELGGGVITDGRHPFLSQTFLATSNEPPRFLSATNPEYSIEVWTLDGELERVVRRLNARRTPIEAEEAAAWDLALENVSSDLHGRVRSLISEGGLLPAIHGLATGPSGEIWTKRDPSLAMTGKAMYDVFDPLGRYLGGVTLPRDVDIQSVGDDYLLATRHDQFDVPYVEVFSLQRR